MRHIDSKIILEWLITTRFVIIAPICAAVFYMGYMFDTSSLLADLNRAQQDEVNIKAQYEVLLLKEAAIKNDILQLPKLKTILDKWKIMLIKSDQLPDLLNDILKKGATYNLRFDLFNPENEIIEGQSKRVPIKMVVKGEFQNILNFIIEIGNLPWIVIVQNFTITHASVTAAIPTDGAIVSNDLNAEISLDVYQYVVPGSLPDKSKEEKPKDEKAH